MAKPEAKMSENPLREMIAKGYLFPPQLNEINKEDQKEKGSIF